MALKLKDQLYGFLVEKHPKINAEYKHYVGAHQEEHQKHRLKHWVLLLKMNFHYRVLKKTNSYFQTKGGQPNNKPPASCPFQGVESSKRTMPTTYAFAKILMAYDAVSFDIFDTLIMRKLNNPNEVFSLVGEKLGIFNFFKIRIDAEKEVRAKKKAMFNNNECTLSEIYERVAYYTGIDAEAGMKTELEIEFDMCFANPYMKQVYDTILGQGKDIYITSNMYLPEPIMRKLLEKCGYRGMKEILVSCDYGCGKGNGALFKVLLSKLPKHTKIVHVGDNIDADIKGASLAKIDARHYVSCRELGTPHRSKGLSPLIGSAYYGIVNNTLHSGTAADRNHSLAWEYGFIYGGIITLGYLNWLHKKAAEQGITKLLFVSRDGYVLHMVYNILFDDIDSEYIYWSRVAAIRNTETGERYTLLARVFGENCKGDYTIYQCLELAGLENLKAVVEQAGLDTSLPMQNEYMPKLFDILVPNWELIERAQAAGKASTRKYIQKIIGSNSKVAVVDLGWSGKNDLPLKRIIEETGATCKIYLLGNICKWENVVNILRGDIECYMFDAGYNREIHDLFCKLRAPALETVEKLFSAPHNSFLSFGSENNAEFASPEVENYSFYRETERGILDFCIGYVKDFEKYPCLMNISGYDAFVPIRLVLRNSKYKKLVFDSVIFNLGIMPTNRYSLNDIL